MRARGFSFSSLQTKIIAVCLLFLAVPSLIIGIVGYDLSKNELDASGQVQLKNDVRFTIALIHDLDAQVKKGTLPLADAQEMVKETMLGKKGADGKRPVSKQFDLGQYGYLFAYDQHGIAIVHPTYEGKNMWDSQSSDGVLVQQEVIKKGLAGGGFTTYIWPMPNDPNKSSEKIVYSEADPDWGWVVSAGSYAEDFTSGSQKILHLLMITLGISLVIGFVSVLLFGRSISIPLLRMANHATRVASGDLALEPIRVKNRDEIGVLARDFNSLVDSLRGLVQQIGASSEQIAASSEELTASAQQTGQAAEQTSATMQQLASGTDEQVRTIDETDRTLKDLAQGLQQIAASAQSVSQTAIHASDAAVEGNEVIQQAVTKMKSLGVQVGTLSKIMGGLGEDARNIGHVVESITGIASQTNLLALNAAIEASRAGEQGRGFAVVADEVRKLAEQSSQMAGQIGESITAIQRAILHAVEAMRASGSEVTGGIEMVALAGESFQQIQGAVYEVAQLTQGATAALQEMSVGADLVSQSVDAIKAVVEEAAAGTQTVSASSEEQLASMEEITASAAALSQMAEDLEVQVKKFIL